VAPRNDNVAFSGFGWTKDGNECNNRCDGGSEGCKCGSNDGRGGSKGDLDQSNSNRSGSAVAGNWNETTQSNAQSQDAAGGNASTGDAVGGSGAGEKTDARSSKGDCGCKNGTWKDDRSGGGDARSGDAYGGDVDQSQDASNWNGTTQEANAESRAEQFGFAGIPMRR
jgi:hypothetical protein